MSENNRRQGGSSLVQRAVGYAHTFCHGEEVVRDDTPTSARPGRLCRCAPDPPGTAAATPTTAPAAGEGGIEYRVLYDLSEIDLTGIDRSESRSGHYEYVGDIGDGVIKLVEEQDEMSGWDDERRTLHMENFAGCIKRGGLVVAAFDGLRLVGAAVLDGEWMGRNKDMLDMCVLRPASLQHCADLVTFPARSDAQARDSLCWWAGTFSSRAASSNSCLCAVRFVQ